MTQAEYDCSQMIGYIQAIQLLLQDISPFVAPRSHIKEDQFQSVYETVMEWEKLYKKDLNVVFDSDETKTPRTPD